MFTLVPETELNERHFNEYPVWARFDDPDDIDEIVSWGIDRAWLLRELEEKHNGNIHAMYPVLRTTPLPEYDVYIGATFVTPGGNVLSGCLVGLDALAIHIFVNGAVFGFCSTWLEDVNQDELGRLNHVLGDPEAALFPLTYETPFFREDGSAVRGVFSAKLEG